MEEALDIMETLWPTHVPNKRLMYETVKEKSFVCDLEIQPVIFTRRVAAGL